MSTISDREQELAREDELLYVPGGVMQRGGKTVVGLTKKDLIQYHRTIAEGSLNPTERAAHRRRIPKLQRLP